jgi:hypothetical protein
LKVFQERLRRWEEVIEKKLERSSYNISPADCIVCRNVFALKLHNITGRREEREEWHMRNSSFLHEFLRVKKSKVSIRSSCIQYMFLDKRHLRIILKMKRDFLHWMKERGTMEGW